MKFSDDLQEIGYTTSNNLQPIADDLDFIFHCIDGQEARNYLLVISRVIREMSEEIERLERK